MAHVANNWNDTEVLRRPEFSHLWDAVEREGPNSKRNIDGVLSCKFTAHFVQKWLESAFSSELAEVDKDTVAIYLGFYSMKRKGHDGEALQYLNAERRIRNLGQLVDTPAQSAPSQPRPFDIRRLKFTKNRKEKAKTTSKPVGKGATTRERSRDRPCFSSGPSKTQTPVGSIVKHGKANLDEFREEPPNPQRVQTHMDERSEVTLGSKRKRLEHDVQLESPLDGSSGLLTKKSNKIQRVREKPAQQFKQIRPAADGILDVSRNPPSDHDHLDVSDAAHLVVMKSEGFQTQDSVGAMEDEKPHLDKPDKPGLARCPPIWAESRQEVCEVFDWFRSYQGGVYHTDNSVKGYLLSAFASKRDVFENNGRLIISHGGGKSESIGCQKGLSVTHQASDQLADDKSVRALLDNYHSGRPLVLLVDDKYALFPYDLSSKGVTYAVLGFYSIVYAWAEFQPVNNGRVIRYKFAFRWCEEQGMPWWCRADDPGPISGKLSNKKDETIQTPRIVSENDFSRKSSPISNPEMNVCSLCGSFSRKVYSIWVCLTTSCTLFWRNPETKESLPDDLEYDKQIFALEPRHPLPAGLNLMLETTVTRAMNGNSTSYAFTRGMHCPACGRLSCRYQWEQLECRSCKKWTKKADIDIRSAKDFWCDHLPVSFEYFQMSSISDFVIEPISSFQYEGGRGSIQTFTLPFKRGCIHHIRTPSAAGMLEADGIFEHYQEDAKSGALKFRRWPMKAHKCRGTLLTNYFSHNAGEPYQYVGGDANTVPFEQVPAVIKARQLIQARIHQALGKDAEFNEVLSCAYMERQKMAFHSDAEVGLGPLVAGLSLGSPALMHFRLHARHDPMYEQRGILLSIVLRHGDILIMDGNQVQEYYEHTVVPNNFRIAATARQITPKHLQTGLATSTDISSIIQPP